MLLTAYLRATYLRKVGASILEFTIDAASEMLRIRILDTSGPRSSKHYANDALRELKIGILDTSGPRSSIHYANYALRAAQIDRPTT